jgi:hypothetical protein
MYQRHYAPNATLKLVANLGPKMAGLTFETPVNDKQIKMPYSAGAYSAVLYDSLHRLDKMKVGIIYVQEPPDGPEWEVVRDRLQRAGG